MEPNNLCVDNIEKMLARSQTKIIFPLITLGLITQYLQTNQVEFTDSQVRSSYERCIKWMKEYLGHDLHIGGKYYDAYPSRNLPKYGVLIVKGNGFYELQQSYIQHANELSEWIPSRVQGYITTKLGLIPSLGNYITRAQLAQDNTAFISLIRKHIDGSPATTRSICLHASKNLDRLAFV